MTLTFLHTLMLFRNGIRVNNIECIYGGKNKLSLLFFGRNHPCYHQLITYEKKIEPLMPHEIRSIKFSSLVLSRTGRLGHYQSGDAIIEEINKEAKRDLVGVPNEHQWRRSFRNLDNMNEIRRKTFLLAGVKDHKSRNYDSKTDISKEVMKIRILIRKNKCLEKVNEPCQHKDITNTISLSTGLANFTAIALNNLNECLPKMFKNEFYKVNVVYSTEAEQIESEKIENRTILEIKQSIISLLDQFSNKSIWLELYKKEVSGKSKSAHIDFYNILLEVIEDRDSDSVENDLSNVDKL